MIRLVFILLILGFSFSPSSIRCQNLNLNEMLSLQNGTLLRIQDYLETNSWKLKRVATLREIDSSVFNLRMSHIIDSIKRTLNRKTTNTNSFYYRLVNTTNLEDPAWLEYQFDYNSEDIYSFINSIVISLPKFHLLSAIDLRLKGVEKYSFNNSIQFSFEEDSVYKLFLSQIKDLKIPDSSSYVKFEGPFITKVYKLPNQVITLTTIKSGSTFYEVGIYSRNDYDFINAADVELRGKADYIQ